MSKRIRQQFLYSVKISFVYERSGPQLSHPLRRLARKEMALVPFPPLDLAGRGHFEPLRSTSMRLQLWHLFLHKKYAGDKPHWILAPPESVVPDRCGNENIDYTLKKNICHGYFQPSRSSRGETDNRRFPRGRPDYPADLGATTMVIWLPSSLGCCSI